MEDSINGYLSLSLDQYARSRHQSPCMEKLNRMQWNSGLSFTSYGVPIGIRTNVPIELGQLLNYLPYRWNQSTHNTVARLYSFIFGNGETHTRGVKRFNLLYGDITIVARTLKTEEMFESFAANVKLYVAEHAKRRIFVHAGVVGWRGKAIVIPGRSYTGKSTLVAELVKAGATYYSDEYAVLDGEGRVYPYAQALSLREKGTISQRRCDVEELKGKSGRESMRVGMVISTEYKERAVWRPQRITEGEAVLEMLSNTVPARQRPQEAMSTLKKTVTGAEALKGRRGEAAHIADRILTMMEGR